MPIALKSTGGGSVTMDVPSTASDFTLTLPAATGTALTTAAAVTVAQGGTGLATLTANNVLLGNGTGTPNFVAPGTSGNLLTSNGTTWQSTTPTAVVPGFSNMSVGTYTAATNSSGTPLVWNSNGSLTFTVPTGITRVKVTVVGGGGAGGGGSYGSGGAGGGTAIKIVTGLTPGGTVAVTVGNGGAGVYDSSGGNGGTSSFAAYATATGGPGGSRTNNGSAGGLGASGDLNIRGCGGNYPNGTESGAGGASFMGGGAGAYVTSPVGGAYGGGGAGSGGALIGYAGASGVVVVEY